MVAAGLAALVAAAIPASAGQQRGREPSVRGTFTLMAMVHSSGINENPTLLETTPWPVTTPGGSFSYSAIPCRGNAPVNNISTNLVTYNSRLPGSRSPASTRSAPLEFTAVERGRTGDQGLLTGDLTLVVCKLRPGPTSGDDQTPDLERDKVFFHWRAQFDQTSPDEVRWSGVFRIIGGTGVYEDLQGSGTIEGYFTCLPQNAPEGCQPLGVLSDGQYTMQGRYRDPTV